jgi:hypothetical protein
MASNDPVREAYNKCSRALEPLATDAERQRVIRALAMLFGLTPFESLATGRGRDEQIGQVG